MDGAEKKKVEDEILLLIQTLPQGVSNDTLIKRLPGVTATSRADAINQLLKEAKIDLFKGKEGLLYKAKAPSKAASISGDQEEKIVYSIVEKAGSFGSWIRDIRGQSNLGQTQLTKVLKSLESKKLIKSVKTVNATKKKVYMLYNLEPDHSVTGGAWYNEQDFDSEFVEILNQQCYRFLEHRLISGREKAGDSGPIAVKNASMVSPGEVAKYIGELGIVKMAMKEADVKAILDTIVADGKAERSESMEGIILYRAVVPYFESAGFSRSPCGVCPVISRCGDQGSVTPATCTYFRDWLDVF
jgi:DNA-directed RNA polymerase III subunit RPC6